MQENHSSSLVRRFHAPPDPFNYNYLTDVAFSTDGKLIAVAAKDGKIRFWNPSTGESHGQIRGHIYEASATAFSPDSRTVVSASHDNTVKLWSFPEKMLIRTLSSHHSWVTSVAFSPNGRILASTSSDRMIKLWNAGTGTLLHTLIGHADDVYEVTFSPDGETLASASSDSTIRLWNPETGAWLSILMGHSDIVTTVAFSPNSEILASGSWDRTIILWDVATGVNLRTLHGHANWVCSVAFSPDGQLLASSSRDKRIKLWNPSTGLSHGTLEGHSNTVKSVKFSPDSRLLASASLDSSVIIWDVHSNEPACGTCKELRDDLRDEKGQQVCLWSELIKGVQNGCRGCLVLMKGIFNHIGIPKNDFVVQMIFDRKGGGPLEVGFGVDPEDSQWLEFYTHIGEPSKWPSIGPGREVCEDSSSNASMELVKSWYEECFKRHRRCPDSCNAMLPKRVLHWNRNRSKLWLRESKGEKERYAALSHCWGPHMPLKTTIATIKEREHGIAFSALPKTFQDAIKIAERLDIYNLWIDSLCILQDSPEDWEVEASKMGETYANAAITIVADAAIDSNSGCFVAGGARLPRGMVLFNDDEDFNKVYVRRILPPGKVGHARAESKESRLSTRGWCFQERLLSPRVVYFSAGELVWECATHHYCECTVNPRFIYGGSFRSRFFPKNEDFLMNDSHWRGSHNKAKMDHITQEIITALKIKTSGDVYDYIIPDQKAGIINQHGSLQSPEDNLPGLDFRWEPVVSHFTKLQLTYQKDRLPALSGLAAAFRKHKFNIGLSDVYMFGLWRRSLVRGLLWTQNSDSNCRQPQGYAPSWSWASVTGEIEWIENVFLQGLEDSYSLISILDCRCIPAGKNEFGPGHGEIDIQGTLAPVHLRREGDCSSNSVYFDRSSDPYLAYAGFAHWDVKGRECEVMEGEQCYLLFIAKSKGGISCEGKIPAILLTALEGKASTYRRVARVTSPWILEGDKWKELGDETVLTIV